MKKKLLLMAAAAVLTVTAIAGGSLAAFSTAAEEQAVTSVAVKSLSLDIHPGEDNQIADGETYQTPAMVPGSEITVPYRVTNSGDYDIYVRVTLNKYFVRDGGKLFGEEYQTDLIALGMPQAQESGWILAYEDSEEAVLYYTRPIPAGESSTDFLESLRILPQADNRYSDLGIGLDVEADAVQAANAARAMPSEWGVYPVFGKNSDGTDSSTIERITE